LGGAFPYIYVIEEHDGGHGLHVHVLTTSPGADALARAWVSGHVNVGRLGSKEDIRRGAAYLSKSFSGRRGGAHRYEVGRGFSPHSVRIQARDRRQVWLALAACMGSEPSEVLSFAPLGWLVWLAWWNTVPP
jgi:hypothetical protein